jgi:magnesium transporter
MNDKNALVQTMEKQWESIKDILLYERRYQKVRDIVKSMRPNEVAGLIHYLNLSLRAKLIRVLKNDLNPDIFALLDQGVRESIVLLIPEKQIVSIIGLLESDDAVSLVAAMQSDQQQKTLQVLDSATRKKIIQGLSYPESSAGRLMQTEILFFPMEWTVKKSLEHIIVSDVPDTVSDAFVVDKALRPVGTISLLTLIKSDKNLSLSSIVDKDIQIIDDTMDLEEVSFTFRMNDLMICPVVNDAQKLVGMITADDVIDVVNKKATEDLLHMGGVGEDDFYQSATRSSFSRARWLLITLVNTFLTSIVISRFQDTLSQQIALTIFMPIAAAMGGNAGIQSTTIVTRALATKELGKLNMRRFLFKECCIAFLNSWAFGTISFVIGFWYFYNLPIALILGASVVFNIFWAGVLGALLPVFIQRMDHDPALSASPLLTTTTDVLGYAIFLGLAKLFLSV